jgi:hypothetical protein
MLDGLHCEVDGVACVVYADVTGPAEEGDEVLVDVQARALGLGSGGFDIVYANLTHGAVSVAEAANAASVLGGVALLAARVSYVDERERHRGLSHHTQSVLDLCLGEVAVSSPDDGAGWREACEGLPLSHMGRGPDEDPSHFAAAYAAGCSAAAHAR